MRYFALLHERSRSRYLYWEPDPQTGSLNMGLAGPLSHRVIKAVVESGDSYQGVLDRVLERWEPYLSPTEVIKIYCEGTELKRVTKGGW